MPCDPWEPHWLKMPASRAVWWWRATTPPQVSPSPGRTECGAASVAARKKQPPDCAFRHSHLILVCRGGGLSGAFVNVSFFSLVIPSRASYVIYYARFSYLGVTSTMIGDYLIPTPAVKEAVEQLVAHGKAAGVRCTVLPISRTGHVLCVVCELKSMLFLPKHPVMDSGLYSSPKHYTCSLARVGVCQVFSGLFSEQLILPPALNFHIFFPVGFPPALFSFLF